MVKIEEFINSIAGLLMIVSFIIAIGLAGGYEKDMIDLWELVFFSFCDLILFILARFVLILNDRTDIKVEDYDS